MERGKSESSPDSKSFSRSSLMEGSGFSKIFGGGRVNEMASWIARVKIFESAFASFRVSSEEGHNLCFPMNQRIHSISSASPSSMDRRSKRKALSLERE